MKTFSISLEDAIDGLLAVVRKFGADHIAAPGGDSSGCKYTDTDEFGYITPVCIVGQFFARMGFLGVVFSTGGEYGTCALDGSLWSNVESHGIYVADDAKAFLRAAQSEQDNGMSWGKALNVALVAAQDKAVEEFKENHAAFVGYRVSEITNLTPPLADW
jgi:hypothetical protein